MVVPYPAKVEKAWEGEAEWAFFFDDHLKKGYWEPEITGEGGFPVIGLFSTGTVPTILLNIEIKYSTIKFLIYICDG